MRGFIRPHRQKILLNKKNRNVTKALRKKNSHMVRCIDKTYHKSLLIFWNYIIFTFIQIGIPNFPKVLSTFTTLFRIWHRLILDLTKIHLSQIGKGFDSIWERCYWERTLYCIHKEYTSCEMMDVIAIHNMYWRCKSSSFPSFSVQLTRPVKRCTLLP